MNLFQSFKPPLNHPSTCKTLNNKNKNRYKADKFQLYSDFAIYSNSFSSSIHGLFYICFCFKIVSFCYDFYFQFIWLFFSCTQNVPTTFQNLCLFLYKPIFPSSKPLNLYYNFCFLHSIHYIRCF